MLCGGVFGAAVAGDESRSEGQFPVQFPFRVFLGSGLVTFSDIFLSKYSFRVFSQEGNFRGSGRATARYFNFCHIIKFTPKHSLKSLGKIKGKISSKILSLSVT